ncbi:MAG TPA: penicillin acylase family protein, partial [Rhodospirillales bacterium]|nr:penicillin acylase family protein [Rhodospirillales bacterium]
MASLSSLRRAMMCLPCLLWVASEFASPAHAAEKVYVEGLAAPVVLARDKNGVVKVAAADEKSMAFAQGYAHARDRLFQMDLLRRSAAGTLAELLGKDALDDDILLRTLGLCRTAERTLPLLSDGLRSVLEAYAAGVNAFREMNPPPPEYPVLGLGEVADWSPVDSVCIAKLVAFQLSVDTDDIDRTEALHTYQAFLGE